MDDMVRKRGIVATKVAEAVHKGQYNRTIKWLTEIRDSEFEEVRTSHVFKCWPTEGAVALNEALEQMFGFTVQQAEEGGFMQAPTPPEMLTIQVNRNTRTQVPWGMVSMPDIQGYVQTGVHYVGNQPYFAIRGTTIKRDESHHLALFDAVENVLKRNSIYKGQPISVRFVDDDGDKMDPFAECPQFIDVEGATPSDAVFSCDVQEQVDTTLFAPIRFRKSLPDAGTPFKRGVLFAGDYGVGKTLLARITGAMCQEEGITFIQVSDASDLSEAVKFAGNYQPAVVFCEDVDRAVTGTRTTALDTVLNTIDGIEAKNTEIMVVVTTNHLDQIHEAMLRPGRIDSTIHITPPDTQAVEQLLTKYGKGLLQSSIDLGPASVLLAGQNPAVIREAVERAKLSALWHERLDDGLATEDLVISAKGIMSQRNLIAKRDEKEPQAIEVLAKGIESLGDAISKANNGAAPNGGTVA